MVKEDQDSKKKSEWDLCGKIKGKGPQLASEPGLQRLHLLRTPDGAFRGRTQHSQTQKPTRPPGEAEGLHTRPQVFKESERGPLAFQRGGLFFPGPGRQLLLLPRKQWCPSEQESHSSTQVF